MQAGGAGPNLNAGVVLLTSRRPPPSHHQAADEADEDKDAKATSKAAEQEESDFVLVFHLVDLATTSTASSHHLGSPFLRLKKYCTRAIIAGGGAESRYFWRYFFLP